MYGIRKEHRSQRWAYVQGPGSTATHELKYNQTSSILVY